MSEIRATTISDAAGTGPITLTKQAAAKAYASFHHVSGVPTLNSGTLNLSSLTDDNTGLVGINFSSSFNSVEDYTCVSDGWDYVARTGAMGTTTRKPSASRAMLFHYENGSGVDSSSGVNFPFMTIAVGDLA